MKNHYRIDSLQAGILRKLVPLLLAFSMLFSAAPAILAAEPSQQIIEQTFTFSAPEFTEEGEYVTISVEQAQRTTLVERAPKLPRHSEVFYLPMNAENIQVDYSTSSAMNHEIPRDKLVTPMPQAVPLLPPVSPFEQTIKDPVDAEVYESHASFGEHVSYELSSGIVNGERQKLVKVDLCPFILTDVKNNQGQSIGEATVTIRYTLGSQPLEGPENVDLLILAPQAYIGDLGRLYDHKEDMGLEVKLVSLNDIYNDVYFEKSTEYSVDNQQIIKYFIYNAIQEWDITYCLIVGGYRTFFGLNNENKQFPMRWVPDRRGDEPGYVTDQYYSCCVDYEGDFDDWDGNGDGVIGGVGDNYDKTPDVYLGRLACRNNMEVRTVIDKIITYETETYGSDWFNKMLTITGDGFQDINFYGDGELDTNRNKFTWDITNVPDGEYTIYAQSTSTIPPYQDVGPVDEVHITIDRDAKTVVTFEETDHLKVEPMEDDQRAVYPGKPLAEIVVPSDGDILGNNGANYIPEEAYIGEYWALVHYEPGTSLDIRVKGYEPRPHRENLFPNIGSFVFTKVWVNNSDDQTIKTFTPKPQILFYEGELECQQAIEYMDANMPGQFEQTKLWCSNGEWTGMRDVIDAFYDGGYGFLYFAGHGNPMSWGDHLPGVPGGRDDGMINGLKSINLDFGLARYESEEGDPMFPMDQMLNGDQQPITLIGGCHNSYIDASLSKLLYDPNEVLFTVLHGAWVPESFSWWLARMPQGGAIGTIGCSGLGYGYIGRNCLNGLGGWINPEFFRVYSMGQHDTLGGVFTQTLTNLALFQWDQKTFEEWVLLGDPSLKIGGYPTNTGALEYDDELILGDIELSGNNIITSSIRNTNFESLEDIDWEIRIDPAAPLARYFGLAGTGLAGLFTGKIFSGGHTSETIISLDPGETLDIASNGNVFGLGHIEVNISVWDPHDRIDNLDDELLQYTTEDGFLLGGRLLLFHPRE